MKKRIYRGRDRKLPPVAGKACVVMDEMDADAAMVAIVKNGKYYVSFGAPDSNEYASAMATLITGVLESMCATFNNDDLSAKVLVLRDLADLLGLLTPRVRKALDCELRKAGGTES